MVLTRLGVTYLLESIWWAFPLAAVALAWLVAFQCYVGRSMKHAWLPALTINMALLLWDAVEVYQNASTMLIFQIGITTASLKFLTCGGLSLLLCIFCIRKGVVPCLAARVGQVVTFCGKLIAFVKSNHL